jgi:hypothetical protein
VNGWMCRCGWVKCGAADAFLVQGEGMMGERGRNDL